ncbi:MAG: sigma-70 family polymerase sigma factor [Conexibacter sp.]|nr:sigma-70 family polymerase sigma factor [Conexibacter sp.]
MSDVQAPSYRVESRADDRLLRRFATTRDPRLKRELVERFLPLARFAAARFARGAEPFDDLVQVASVGLLKAIERYDPDYGAAFSSYALPTMLGELRRHFRDRSWAVRPPRTLQEHALRIEQVGRRLQRQAGIAPTVPEVARASELTEEEVLEALQALDGRRTTSLSPTDDEKPGLHRTLGRLEAGFGDVEQRSTITHLGATLTRREREVIHLRFVQDLTQAEIGTVVGVSQMQVSRILRIALAKMRAAAEKP